MFGISYDDGMMYTRGEIYETMTQLAECIEMASEATNETLAQWLCDCAEDTDDIREPDIVGCATLERWIASSLEAARRLRAIPDDTNVREYKEDRYEQHIGKAQG